MQKSAITKINFFHLNCEISPPFRNFQIFRNGSLIFNPNQEKRDDSLRSSYDLEINKSINSKKSKEYLIKLDYPIKITPEGENIYNDPNTGEKGKGICYSIIVSYIAPKFILSIEKKMILPDILKTFFPPHIEIEEPELTIICNEKGIFIDSECEKITFSIPSDFDIITIIPKQQYQFQNIKAIKP